LQTVPALTGGLTMVTWVIWGIGTVLLLLMGEVLHLLIAIWCRHRGGSSQQSTSQLANLYRN
jgi:hypothetical protein